MKIINSCLNHYYFKRIKMTFTKTFFRMKDEERILIGSEGPHMNVIKLKPPMVFTKDNASQFLKAFKNVISSIKTQRK